jgi:hypothetical protein
MFIFLNIFMLMLEIAEAGSYEFQQGIKRKLPT